MRNGAACYTEWCHVFSLNRLGLSARRRLIPATLDIMFYKFIPQYACIGTELELEIESIKNLIDSLKIQFETAAAQQIKEAAMRRKND
ncbi:MAG: hypothetical protein IPO77_01875 [Acidobacteria bacterium]|nr:hypothetical protein [Acidobacteriota bacterium]